MRLPPVTVPTLEEIRAPVASDLEEVTERMAAVLRSGSPLIADVNGHLFRTRGKLFRPMLLLLAARAAGRRPAARSRLASVIELIHLATLVHDDAIDESQLRRGLPTVNAKWDHRVSVIMGDYLYSRAMAELAGSGDLTLIAMGAEVTNAMAVGEMMQLARRSPFDAGEVEYFTLIERKTASLIATACAMGAHVGSPEHRAELERFGLELGMAFQIVDDLLDLCGEESVMGKPTGVDLRELKPTLPLLYAYREGAPAERERLRAAFAASRLADGEEAWLIEFAADSGGLDHAREVAARHAEAALAEIAALPASEELRALQGSIAYVLQRER